MARLLRRLFLFLTSTSVLVTATLVAAAPASADVLVEIPRSQVCVGDQFRVGVWYQEFSGGPRTYRLRVTGPSGHVVLSKHGKATVHWKYWHVTADAAGVHKTLYRPGRGVEDQWHIRARTRATRCP